MTPFWYLVAYDIHQPRRGQRVYREIRKHGTMLLESLYLCHGTGQELNQRLARLRHLAGPSASDVVAYRLRPSQPIHLAGTARPTAGIHEFGLPSMSAWSACDNEDGH
ncbi:CRISPR-associated endonuclease Cas2 [Denitratimonas sp. CY0512]|uniref:CRISPR-associated endonuclease Cas2 n=1 Tax=Denitratimonas sp. CY0512 TaxID=3131940 RepID=UPI00309FE200